MKKGINKTEIIKLILYLVKLGLKYLYIFIFNFAN